MLAVEDERVAGAARADVGVDQVVDRDVTRTVVHEGAPSSEGIDLVPVGVQVDDQPVGLVGDDQSMVAVDREGVAMVAIGEPGL